MTSSSPGRVIRAGPKRYAIWYDGSSVKKDFKIRDHHSTKLTESLIELQHTHTLSSSLQVISSMHVHLDEHDCLEVIILKGRVGEINKVAESILSMKGVKLGRLNIVAT